MSDLAPDTVVTFPGEKKRPKTGGRLPGSKNRRTQEIEAAMKPLVPKALKALRRLLIGTDDELAHKAAVTILAYAHGKPIDRREVSGPDGGPQQREDVTRAAAPREAAIGLLDRLNTAAPLTGHLAAAAKAIAAAIIADPEPEDGA